MNDNFTHKITTMGMMIKPPCKERVSSGTFTTKLNFIFPVLSFPLLMCFTTSSIPLGLSWASIISAIDMEAFPINFELDATLAKMFSAFLTENFQFKLLHDRRARSFHHV